MTAIELLEGLNLLDEHERIEAKRASEVGKSVLETVFAFSNEPGLSGGWIVLGVVREEMTLFPSYQIEGIASPDKITANLASQCRDVFNVPVRVDISTESVNEAGAIDNATYRELNKVDALAASGSLRRLRDAGLLA